MREKLCLVSVACIALLLPMAAQAQVWELGARVIGVIPDDSSDPILDTASKVAVGDACTLEVDLELKLGDRWGIEVIGGTTEHDITVVHGLLDGASAGSVWALPPTFTLLHHFPIGLYLGMGVNYTVFYGYDLSDDLRSLGVSGIEFSDSFGLAGDIGFDLALGDSWYFNVDLKYIQISTDARLVLESGGYLDEISVDVNPWVPGIGFGYRF